MANRHDWSTREVLSPDNVGAGTGETAAGEARVCVLLQGASIHPGTHENGWISLTPEAARELHKLLGLVLAR